MDNREFQTLSTDRGVDRLGAAGGEALGAPFDVGAALGTSKGNEADIEGVARVGDRIYWIGSHGRDGDAVVAPTRQRLFATSWDGSTLAMSGRVRSDLLPALLALGDAKGFDFSGAEKKAPKMGGINIEGLATGDGGALLLGFRSPLVPAPEDERMDPNAEAIVVPLLNPAELVDTAGSVPRFGEPIPLRLGGRGIRSLERRPDGSYLIVAGPIGKQRDFALFHWSGRPGAQPTPIAAELAPLSPEAMVINADGSILLLSDDGEDACKDAKKDAKRFRARTFRLDD